MSMRFFFTSSGAHKRCSDFSPPTSIHEQYAFCVMQSICLAATLLVPLLLVSQDLKRPILSSHDRVHGPLGGEYHVEDLQVFADGKVEYVEEGTATMADRPERSVFKAIISTHEVGRLAELLDSREIRSLPRKISSKTRPVDLLWQKSLEINRPDKTQEIQIENFYPFLNVHQPVYPKALIALECSLQNIESEAAQRPRPKVEDDWCGAIRDQSGPSKTECRDDAEQPRIVAGEGWGPVRIGAALQVVGDFLGLDRF